MYLNIIYYNKIHTFKSLSYKYLYLHNSLNQYNIYYLHVSPDYM